MTSGSDDLVTGYN